MAWNGTETRDQGYSKTTSAHKTRKTAVLNVSLSKFSPRARQRMHCRMVSCQLTLHKRRIAHSRLPDSPRYMPAAAIASPIQRPIRAKTYGRMQGVYVLTISGVIELYWHDRYSILHANCFENPITKRKQYVQPSKWT